MLEVRGIVKSFAGVRAVDDVTLSIGPGEILGLVGENGAGKTTLMRIVAGELAADRGSFSAPPRVELVHQHFMLVGDFTIAENLVLSSPDAPAFLSRRRLRALAEEIVEGSGVVLTGLDRRVEALSVGERARLELVKALSRRPQLLILDEPTSVLTPIETDELFDVIRSIAAQGTAVVFISHKVPEVLALAQRVVVMRAGRVIADSAVGDTTPQAVADAMVGTRTQRIERPAAVSRQTVLRLTGLTTERLAGVTMEVTRGEIVAIAGVAGNGQADLASALRGLLRPRSGSIALDGVAHSPSELQRSGRVGHIPEDRTRDALVGEMSVAENIALVAPRWDPAAAHRTATHLIELYGIRAQSAGQQARHLSGGNQQKVILARELDRRPELLVASEPTRGLDVAATNFVHGQLLAAAAAGAGILLITSDLDEAFALADKLHVLYRGRLSAAMSVEEAKGRVATLMAGVA